MIANLNTHHGPIKSGAKGKVTDQRRSVHHSPPEPRYTRFTGLSSLYSQYRPKIPEQLIRAIIQFVPPLAPELVVDLGSGSGLSTFPWAPHTRSLIGVEPNQDSISAARRAASAMGLNNVSFIQGTSDQTTLPEASVDIVTCSSSFHWMDPAPTLDEVNRILKPGGIFAVYKYLLPPVVNSKTEAAFRTYEARLKQFKQDAFHGSKKHPCHKHQEFFQQCGHFRYIREFHLHREELATPDKFINLLLTGAHVNKLLREGRSEDEVGLTRFRKEIEDALHGAKWTWLLSYRVLLGIK